MPNEANTTRPTTAVTQVGTVDDGRLSLPHWNVGDSIGAVEVQATGIVGDRAMGCVWISYGGGSHPAIWPPGTYALFAPLRIFDKGGNVLWTEGEARPFGGSPRAEGDTSAVPTKCKNGQDTAVVASVG